MVVSVLINQDRTIVLEAEATIGPLAEDLVLVRLPTLVTAPDASSRSRAGGMAHRAA